MVLYWGTVIVTDEKNGLVMKNSYCEGCKEWSCKEE
jgi:hypothetical protein